MIDAARAETLRLVRNRTAVFWSVVFVPAMVLIISIGMALFSKHMEQRLAQESGLDATLTGGPIDIGQFLVGAVGEMINPAVLLFLLIGAATVYATDYRWETWRLISARDSRSNLLLGKVAAVAGMALAVMVALLIAGLLGQLFAAILFTRPLAFSMTGAQVGEVAAMFGLGWARLMQFTVLALLAAVMTRSLLAALVIPLAIGGVQVLALPTVMTLMQRGPDSWVSLMTMPGSAFDALKAILQGQDMPLSYDEALPLKATISIVLWIGLPLIGALVWFRRQDLAKE